MHTMTTLTYLGNQISAVEKGGQIWLGVSQLVIPLGYTSQSGLTNLFTRNQDEFLAEETDLITIQTSGGVQQVRVFSLRGARLLALLAKTLEGKAFRRWALDLMEGRVRPRGMPKGAVQPLSFEGRRILDFLSGHVDPGTQIEAVIQGLRDGSLTPMDDPALEEFVDDWLVAVQMQRQATAEFTRIKALAQRQGYAEDLIKAAVRRRKLLTAGQDLLPLEAQDA